MQSGGTSCATSDRPACGWPPQRRPSGPAWLEAAPGLAPRHPGSRANGLPDGRGPGGSQRLCGLPGATPQWYERQHARPLDSTPPPHWRPRAQPPPSIGWPNSSTPPSAHRRPNLSPPPAGWPSCAKPGGPPSRFWAPQRRPSTRAWLEPVLDFAPGHPGSRANGPPDGRGPGGSQRPCRPPDSMPQPHERQHRRLPNSTPPPPWRPRAQRPPSIG